MTAQSTSPSVAAQPEEVARDGWSCLKWILVVALLVRLAALVVFRNDLADDRDSYLALAQGLASGQGYSVPGSDRPTAFRPPLYPLLLMPSALLSSGVWVGVLHLALGLITVGLSYLLAVRLTSRVDVACVAALLVAVDPILLRYVAMPMTETLAACLVTALLVAIAGAGQSLLPGSELGRSIGIGVLFGLAALCRPTVWAFAGLVALWCLARWIWQWWRPRQYDLTEGAQEHGRLRPWAITIAAVVVLLPWGFRNGMQFGRPILMTTHGGYTLLLGNNPHFIREVVDQPWGTVWDGTIGGGQAGWVATINREMDEAGLDSEIARDRWMRDRALASILADPPGFARACWLRARRFWGLMPIEGASDQAPWVRRSIGVFYLVTLLSALLGTASVIRHWSSVWTPSLLMVAAFWAVHLVYWTNIRMRAPIVPVLAVLAASGMYRLRDRLRRTT